MTAAVWEWVVTLVADVMDGDTIRFPWGEGVIRAKVVEATAVEALTDRGGYGDWSYWLQLEGWDIVTVWGKDHTVERWERIGGGGGS